MCNDRVASNSTSLQNKYNKQSFGRVVTNGKRRWMAECVPPFARKIEHFAAARRRRHTRDGRSKTTHESTQIQTKNTFAQRNCQNHREKCHKMRLHTQHVSVHKEVAEHCQNKTHNCYYYNLTRKYI